MKRFPADRIIDILLCLAIALYAIVAGGEFLLFGAPKGKVTCIAENYPVMTVSHADKQAKEVEVDDWRVSCSLFSGEEKIFEQALPLAHPTSFREAMDAIDEFRRKRAPQILKEANQKGEVKK